VNVEGAIVGANEAFCACCNTAAKISSRSHALDGTQPAECRERDERALEELNATGTVQPYEKEFFRKDAAACPC